MEWIKEKPPLEKEKSDKQISKQIDQNAKATTNLLEKVRKYRRRISVVHCKVPKSYQSPTEISTHFYAYDSEPSFFTG